MIDKQFKKEAFKESVKENVKFLYRKKLEEATQEQIFQAVCYTVKDVIIDNWLETQNAYQRAGSENGLLHVHGISDGTCSWKQPDQPDCIQRSKRSSG